MDNVQDITIAGRTNDGFGMHVGFTGDVNGDGNRRVRVWLSRDPQEVIRESISQQFRQR